MNWRMIGMKMMKKSEIKELREKFMLGLRGAPREVKDLNHRKVFRLAAVYVLGIVLGLPPIEEGEDDGE
jgi:transposase